jgi:hypothetical protein
MGAYITRAMRAFAVWASDRPVRLVVLTVLSAHLLAPVAAALLIVDALRRGPGPASLAAAAAIAGLIALSMLLGAELAVTLSLAAPVVIGGAAIGALLRWARSLSLTFQGTVMGVIVVTVIAFLVVPDAGRVGEILQGQVLTLLETGGAGAEQLAQFAAVDSAEFVRVFLISILLSLAVALMLGLWWYSLIREGIDFGAEFRALKLGRVAGIALMLLVIVGQLTSITLIQDLAPLAVIGFLFQGLAVLHARRYSDKWPRAVLVVVYLALLSPWTVAALMAVSAVGLLDNFFELRTRVETKA